ncbi:MAG: tRNA glutamyl-Q(34) synthetase GluQRS [Acidaminococcaceae bacterium]|nr:tRNA glutamyl-Q(34) synthetase GluQRS [Acidaminococcaceae bacterium]MBQ8491281.1 tRNA glutamyl-Q(34) synthetase GluQRS [Acidaminococcaceae bacterium]MBQ9319670.1 tRNA glutamyl-Q(34) synthetase GluQRS [Acidaminococcaceae bacterium]MBR1511076.1 tRNA glutamyl-Q(34) synthetase GluQRS [Acidaminococcaceae bacterium]
MTGRFAPSPSGRMHLGNIYTALAAWLCARKSGGSFLLRIEDLDPMRCPRNFAEQIFSDLEWLGITWDNSPVPFQSERTAIYEKYYELLKNEGLVYPCFCSRAQLHVADAPHASDGRVVYAGTCRHLTVEEIRKKEKQRRPAARLILPEEEVRFTDGHFGSHAFNLARDLGDIIIRRSDGVFAYQLAVTIDDGLMGVTQVVRGWDLLSSSAPQIYLFRLLGFDLPRYLHLPLLITEDGARLAKRDKAADAGFLRSQLPGPEPLIGYIAYLLGQIDKPESMTATELLPLFDDKKIPGHDIVIPGNYWEKL